MPKARGAAGAQGGLAGALNSALQKHGGIWFGWSGQESQEGFAGGVATQSADGVTIATVDLSQRDIDEYYNGYANATLWPLFHYRLDLTEYERETGKGYERVNEAFAEAVTPLIEEDDLVWVHDYHLIPLGERLRSRGVTNRIGFFLHIPWPPTNLFVSLPYHERLVRTMLQYDLVGFQTEEWLESFLHYCTKELGAEVERCKAPFEEEAEPEDEEMPTAAQLLDEKAKGRIEIREASEIEKTELGQVLNVFKLLTPGSAIGEGEQDQMLHVAFTGPPECYM